MMKKATWLAFALTLAACGRGTPGPLTPAAAVSTPQAATALAPTAPPSAASPSLATAAPGTASAADWEVEFVQAGQALPIANDTVTLARAPFTLRVRLDAPLPVKLNAATTDLNFQALQPGFVFTDDCVLALCTGMDVAEERLNPDRALFVDLELTHYLYYQAPDDHRWSRAEVTPAGAVLERDVAVLNDVPIEQSADPALFLLLFVDSAGPGQIDPGELKKITLIFE